MKNKITNLLLLSIILFTLQACMSNTDKTSGSQGSVGTNKDSAFDQKLSALKNKNPERDARAAIANGNKKFIAKAGRGFNVPGIAAADYEQVKGACGLNYADGFGDVIYGEKHREYYGAFLEYAKRYNTAILKACR